MAPIRVNSALVEMTFGQDSFAMSNEGDADEPVVSLMSKVRSNVAVIVF